MTRWDWRVPSVSLLTTLTVAPLTWLAVISSGPVGAGAAVGAAVVTVGGPFLVSWVHERRVAKKLADALSKLPSRDSPAGLLRADRHVVPFTGRAEELADLREWCRDRKPGVRLLVGAGGVGKTRLALELRDHVAKTGWQVAVVGAGREADAFTILRDATRRSSIFLIVDYAETRTGLLDLLRSVAGHPAHVRVLLIARSAGDWWWQLGADEGAVQELIEAYPPLELSARVDSAISPTELIDAAVRSFAAKLGVRVPTGAAVTSPAGEVPVLALHAVALLAVLRSRDPWAPAGPLMADIGVLTELLRHERRFWAHSAEQAGLGLDPVVLQRAVVVACLFGAVDERDGAQVLRRVPDLRDDERDRRRVARWLAQLYPNGSGYWGLLQPELVAETHVIEQLEECPELVMAELSELRIEQKRRMLRVLSMAAVHHPAGVELLERVLRADIEPLVCLALEVAEVTGGAVSAALARVLSDTPVTLETLRTIEQAIPYPTTALVETAVVVTRRILCMLPVDAHVAETARWHLRLGVVLAQAGRADEALPPIEIAVEHYRTLVESDRPRYLPNLARSLHNLGIRNAEQGRHDAALRDTEEAVKYYRELVEHNPGYYRADLAASLSNLGLRLAELGRHTKARAPLKEAVQLYRELVETDDRYRRDLARASSNLRRSEPHVPLDVGILEKAVEDNRALVETNGDRHWPELARSLCDLGNGYTEQDQWEQARGCFEEALGYYRTATESLDRYRPDLAACLNDLGATLTALGDYAAALPYAEEAVAVHRGLTEINLARYRPELARSLDNLAFCLASMGHHREVLPYAEEAVMLYRHLVKIDSDSYRPELARALSNRGVSLSELRRHAEALPDSEEAVNLYQELNEIDPRQYSAPLARALHRLAVDDSALGRHAEADRYRQDADLLTEAMRDDPDEEA